MIINVYIPASSVLRRSTLTRSSLQASTARMRILILRRLETPSRFINGFFGSTIEPILRFLEAIKSETAPVRLCCRNGAVCFMLPLFQQGLRHSRPYRIFLKLLCFAAQYDSISEQGKITPPMMRPWAENRCCPCSRMLSHNI